MLHEDGSVIETYQFTEQNQPPFVEPQAWHRIVSASADVGCQLAFYMNLRGFDVTAYDKNLNSISSLKDIISSENLSGIRASPYDINKAALDEQYNLIISTVVLMFLERERIPFIVRNMQECTVGGDYNLIVAAMSTEDFPCPLPFSFTFQHDELRAYYAGWDILKYNEEVGELHKTDENSNRIKLCFATLLARKTQPRA